MRLSAQRGAAPAHVLLDPQGKIGRLYGASVTPTMFVIRADGTVAYAGAADSIPSARAADLEKAEPYARDALRAVLDGRPAAQPRTRAYGRVIRYES